MARETLEYERVDCLEVYHSETQGPDKPVEAVIHDDEELRKALPGISLPTVDFSKQQLIAVALGDKTTNGYDVHITSVMYFTDRLQGRPSLTSITYSDTEIGGPLNQEYRPIHVVSTRRLQGDVEFQRNVVHG